MALETNLDTFPFWNSYNSNNKYYDVLFRASTAIQARELNELQSILQNQIAEFGDSIYVDGTIIKGCAFTFDSSYFYVKVMDLQVNGEPVNISEFANCIIQNAANVSAIVLNTQNGLQTQNPNLNTLFVKYISAGANSQQYFLPSDILNVYARNYGIQSTLINNGGSGYSNNDTVIYTSNTGGSGAIGQIVTNPSGTIIDVIQVATGNNYLINPTVSIANSTLGTSNGISGSLSAYNTIAQLTVAANSFANTSNSQYNPVGIGYAFRVSDGIIYQKGFFLENDAQTIVVSPYTTIPDQLTVGFVTNEAIVNNSVDTSLNDNAQGSTNFNAPGAFRLQLTPALQVLPSANAVGSNNFFSIVSFENGVPVKQNQTSSYSQLGTALAQTVNDQSGNYVVSPFGVSASNISGNNTYLQAQIGAGVGYVNGYRIQSYGTQSIPLRKGTDIVQKQNVNISTSYANYVPIKNLQGVIPFNLAPSISLRDTAGSTPTSGAGNEIGTAKVRSLVYNSGNPDDPLTVYNLYIFDVVMNSGQNFNNVRSIFYNGGGIPNNGAADIKLDVNGNASILETAFDTLLFPFNQNAIKTIRNLSGNNTIEYIYSTVDQTVSFAANGTLQKTLTGSYTFPYSGTLDNAETINFIVTTRGSANVNTTFSGNVVSNTSSNALIANGATTFLSSYTINDYIVLGTGDVRQITSIANNTYLTMNAVPSTNASTTHTRTYPQNTPIAFYNYPLRSISVSGNQLTLNLGETLSNTLAVNAVYNVQVNSALQLTKNLIPSNYVNLANSTQGQTSWCLGIVDAFKLISVTYSLNPNYTSGAINATSNFILDTGQKDDYYGLAYLRVNPANPITITPGMYIQVNFSSFSYTNTGGGLGFFDIDSYPINDTSGANTQVYIKTQQIPVYTSTSSGQAFDLRNTLDFRPVIQNTANTSANNTANNITVNPANTETFVSTEKYFPAPNELFSCSLQYYQGRYDLLALNSQGQFSIVPGIPSNNPVPPSGLNGTMTLATINVPPYPTLSTSDGVLYGRPDETITITLDQNSGYTMKDINSLDNRITNLEYYTSLNLLEQQTTALNIINASTGLNVFKNGIFVDSFNDFSCADVNNPEFTAAIDTVTGELIPRFEQQKHNLKIANSTGITLSNNLATLTYTSSPMITQPYATLVRNCTDDYYNFTGTLNLYPSYDNFFDTTVNPNITITG